MGFKKKKLNSNNKFLTLISSIIIIFIIWLGIVTIGAVDGLMWKSNYKTWSWVVKTDEKWEKYFKKDINVLIVWRWWAENDAPNLTDSIILAKVNKEKKTVALLSVQRDLYVAYPEKDWHWKLNSVYSHYYITSKKDEKYAMGKLSEKIKDITWEDVDYYVNIDFAWFRNIIDSIWWIEIDVQKWFVDREYPDVNWTVQTISFEKWLQKMDWDRALKFARSRHSTSDFDRSLRQQQVLQAIKTKLTTIEGLWEANIASLFSSLMKNFTTDISLNDAVSLAIDLWILKENYKFLSSNFNDTCFDNSTTDCVKWWILYVPKRDLFWWHWVSLLNWSTKNSLSKYDLSRKYSNLALNFPKIAEENYEVFIYNWTKTSWAWTFVNWLKRYWFNTSFKNVKNAPESFDKTVVFFSWIDENSDTINWLKEFFKWEFIQLSEPKYQFNGRNLETSDSKKARIEIIIWKDYFQNKSIFNF